MDRGGEKCLGSHYFARSVGNSQTHFQVAHGATAPLFSNSLKESSRYEVMARTEVTEDDVDGAADLIPLSAF